MSFVSPGFLVAAGAVAAAAILLHFIITREPDLFRLPTARFAPERPIQARTRAIEPSDLPLLVIRVALLLAVGAALARPVPSPVRRGLIRIVALDRSRVVASAREAADSARSVLGPRDVLIVFDSSAVMIATGAADSLARLALAERQGRLSTALIVALRAASTARDQADSVELVLVSPLAVEEIDAATDSLRALWPGGIRLIQIAARFDAGAPAVIFEGAADDPLRLALRAGGSGSTAGGVRVIRRLATAPDSIWASAAGRALVVWPSSGEAPAGWIVRSTDTMGAVAAGRAVVVAPFVRTLSLRGGVAGDAIARWVDGEPAAVEAPLGAGCIRTVTIDVPAIGDLVLESRFASLVSSLVGRCGGEIDARSLGDEERMRLAGAPGTTRALAAGFSAPDQVPTPWSKWLLLGAVLLAALETLIRRRIAR